MREIKFRAYGEIQCYYLTSSGWKPKKQMCQVSSLNIKTHKCRVLYKGENGTNEYDTFELSKVNLMQYTGLKDKNGKEIYESDIITVFENVNGITKPWKNIVCFKSGAFCLYDPNCCKVCKDGFGITCTLLEGKYIGELEVIGNIYENPELLK